MAVRAFRISSAKPVAPKAVSNTQKPPVKKVGPITVTVGGRNKVAQEAKAQAVVARGAAPKNDPNAEKKRAAAAALKDKIAETKRQMEAREETLSQEIADERKAREAAAKTDEASRAEHPKSAGAVRKGKDAETVKAEAKARVAARNAQPVIPQGDVNATVAAAEQSPSHIASPTATMDPPPPQVDTPQIMAQPRNIHDGPTDLAGVPEIAAPPKSHEATPLNTTPTETPSTASNPNVEAIVALATLCGITPSRHDVADALGTQTPVAFPEGFARAIDAVGLKAVSARTTELRSRDLPAITLMTTGQIVVVRAIGDDVLTIADAHAPDGVTEVNLRDFMPYFTGHIVKAGQTLESIATRYVPDLSVDHWFWGQFKSFRKQIGEIALGSLVANLLAVAVALFSLQVYDRVIPHQSLATLWVLALGAGLAIGLEAVLKLARARLMDGSGRQIEMKVQSLLMHRILGMRSDARPQSASGLFSAMREFGSVREFFTSSTIGTVADIPFIFLFFALVASIAGPVVFILMFGAVLMVLPGYFMQQRMMRLTKETQGASMQASRVLHEAIFEHDTLKSQRGEARVHRIWEELNALSTVKSSDQRKLASVLQFWSQGIQQVTYVAAVVAGAYLVFAGDFTVGTIIATGILTSRTLGPLAQLSGVLARWTNVKTALDGLDAIADAPQETDPSRSYLRRDDLQGEYRIRELQFRYEADGAPNLDIPGVDIQTGQKIALLGANGSGKSTFLKVLAGLYGPSQGRVVLDGAELGQIDTRDLRRNIGYLSQDVRLFAGTLRDNLNLGGFETDDARLFEALDFTGLGRFVRSHHRGLDIDIRDGGEGLSVGQRQSIGWARLWLQDPKICLLDEPTAALDSALETSLISRLGTWLNGRTAIIATHRMPIVGLAERTMIFKAGRLVVDGPRDQVTAHLEARAKQTQAQSGAGS